MTDREWDAGTYHEISKPQQQWGSKVLARLALRGDETVLDAGCGSGQLTGELLRAHPHARVIALDGSANMLVEAKKHLAAFGDRVSFVHADLGHLALESVCDVVFSTATFHWVSDHDALFRGLFAALRPGGKIVAQGGGEGNLARHYGRVRAFRKANAALYEGFVEPTNFQGVEATRGRLARVGFSSIDVGLEDAPTTFADEPSYRRFVETVTVRHDLERLATDERKQALLDELTRLSKADEPSFTLDYVRLNIAATR